ncbi:hypothetical protein [Massilia rubra]|uniref:Uncharacterized protein n=1 Tax=Massilia rubra TaxID=2607910 RepID=A0ABX0LMU5_9BURK|nr:hypothetical protein [Massilia rubra]NHZ35349.1 hypothetical protein [Massilia rubra]
MAGLLLVIAIVLTSGCASAPPRVQEVKVPVYRSCVTAAPARPTFATRTLAPDASDGEKVLALAPTISRQNYDARRFVQATTSRAL